MHFKTIFTGLCLGVAAMALGQPPFVSQSNAALTYFDCTQKSLETPVFSLQIRDPLTQVKSDKPYRTLTVFRSKQAFAFEPALGMGFGDAEQEMGFEIGNGRVSLFHWLGNNGSASLLFGKESRDLECKKKTENVEERFRHVPRTYLTEGTPECLGNPEQNPALCKKVIHFRTDGKVLFTDRTGTIDGTFSIIQNKARVTLVQENQTQVLQFTLMGDEWQTIRLDRDGTLWKFQTLDGDVDRTAKNAIVSTSK